MHGESWSPRLLERLFTDIRDSPGRFFVAHELKMILAYLVQNYEIKALPEKPKVMWLGTNVIPPVQTTIEVRRRKAAV